MLSKINPLTAFLVGIIVVMVISFFAALLGYIVLEHTHSDYNGDYLILMFKSSNKKPYKSFECQHSSKYFFISCGFIEVLENADTVKGPPPGWTGY